jgi:hypothetical protein
MTTTFMFCSLRYAPGQSGMAAHHSDKTAASFVTNPRGYAGTSTAGRAAYVLREAFDYPYREIAEIVRTTETAARQLVSRARKHLAAERRTPAEPAEQRRLLTAFVAAAQAGDLPALEQLFAADVVSYSDGGGVARASRIPVHGAMTVAKYVRAFADRFWAGVAVAPSVVNGAHAVQLSRDGKVFAVLTVTASAEGIDQVLWMMNPGKLAAAV